MAHDLRDDLEVVGAGDDYDYEFEFDDDAGGDGLQTSGGTSQSNMDQGKDMQGIPWERLNYSRDQYRQMRLKQYKNYESLARPRDGLEKERQRVETRDSFYDFQSNTRHVKPTIVHFQVCKQVESIVIMDHNGVWYDVKIVLQQATKIGLEFPSAGCTREED